MKLDNLAKWVVTTFTLFIIMMCGVFYINVHSLSNVSTGVLKQIQPIHKVVKKSLTEIKGVKIATTTKNFTVTESGDIYMSGYGYALNEASTPVMTDVDPATFVEIGGSYAKDKYKVYYLYGEYATRILSHEKPASFTIIFNTPLALGDEVLAKSESAIYFPIEEGFIASTTKIDTNSFQFLGKPFNQESGVCCFAKDRFQYYFVTTQKSVYITPIGKIDEKTFHYLGNYFAKDKDRVFIFNADYAEAPLSPVEIIGADSSTFHMTENMKLNSDGSSYDAEDSAQDKYRSYSLEKLMNSENEDSSTFLKNLGFTLKYFPPLEPQR